MKKILGNIILLLLSINLFANVSLKTDKLALYPGDSLNITISASGKNITFPDIDQIAGYPIEGIANGSSTTIVNGTVTNSQTKTYTITPAKSFTIPKLKVVVDGNEEFTKPKNITVLDPSKQKAAIGGDFSLILKPTKTHLRVGESTTIKVIFKKRVEARADKIYIDELKNSNFWIKKSPSQNQYIDGDYEVVEQTYTLTAQKPGEFTINPLRANIGYLVKQKLGSNMGGFNDPFFESFFQTMKYKKLFSNAIVLKVDPLPNNLEVFGDFKINATVDKREVEANKPVNLTIKITGEGNIEDIKKFSLNIPDAIVYSDEPTTTNNTFIQKVAIIANKDYTIPPIKFTYFNKYQNKPVTIKTKPIAIKVKGSPKSTKTPTIITSQKQTPITKERVKVITKSNTTKEILLFLLGLLSGVIVTFLFFKLKTKKSIKKETSLEKQIFKAKNDKELYNILLPFASKKEIKQILEKLEENIYNNKNNKIDKNEILDILEE